MRKLIVGLFCFFICSPAFALNYQYKYNPFTGRQDMVVSEDSVGVGVPGGADTNVQYNDSGAFGGDAGLTWDKTNAILKVDGTNPRFDMFGGTANQNWSQQVVSGAYYIREVDDTGATLKTPLIIAHNTPSNAFYMNSTGLALGHTSPSELLHISAASGIGDTPTIRIQNSSTLANEEAALKFTLSGTGTFDSAGIHAIRTNLPNAAGSDLAFYLNEGPPGTYKEMMRIAGTGRVSIGKQPGTAYLDILAVEDDEVLKLTANAAQTADIMQVLASDGTTEYFTIEDDGKVACGNKAAEYKLHVYDSVNAASGVKVENDNAGTSSAAAFYFTGRTSDGYMAVFPSDYALDAGIRDKFVIGAGPNASDLRLYAGYTGQDIEYVAKANHQFYVNNTRNIMNLTTTGMDLASTGTANTVLDIWGAASQSADLLTLNNSVGTKLSAFDAAGQLTLDNNQAYGNTTGLAFGDGDTGFYELADDTLGLQVGGTYRLAFTATHAVRSGDASGGAIVNESASGTNPTLIPYLQDNGSGIGSSGANHTTVIAQGTNIIDAATDQVEFYGGLSTIDSSGYGFVWTASFAFALGTDATTGSNVTGNKVVVPFNGKIVKAIAYATTGPAGADLIFDIDLNGTSIWASTQANRVKVADGANLGTQTSFDTTAVTANDLITLNCDQVGSGTAGQNITVELVVLCKNQ